MQWTWMHQKNLDKKERAASACCLRKMRLLMAYHCLELDHKTRACRSSPSIATRIFRCCRKCRTRSSWTFSLSKKSRHMSSAFVRSCFSWDDKVHTWKPLPKAVAFWKMRVPQHQAGWLLYKSFEIKLGTLE